MKQHIEDFLKFLESRDNRKAPLEAKLLYPDTFSPITKEELYVEGDFDLSSTDIEFLPDNLIIHADFVLAYTNIKSLPDNLQVGGDLDISYTVIDAFPNNLKVGGNLHIWETPIGEIFGPKEIKQEIERKGGYVKGSIQI